MDWDNLSRHQDEITNPQPPGSGPISPFLDACATSPNKPLTTSKTSNSGSDTLRRPSDLPSPATSSSDDPQSPVIVESGENSDRLSVVLHEPPSTILTHIMTPATPNSSDNKNNTTQNKLKQKLLKTSLNPTSSIVHWSYIFEKTKSYVAVTLLLKLTVMKQDENEIIIRVTSVNEQDLDATTFTPSTPQTPASADKNLLLLLNDGVIVLQPLPLKQTKFTFTSQFSLATPVRSSFSSKLGTSIKVRKSIKNSKMNKQTPLPGLKSTLGFGGEGIDSNSLFREIAALFYEEFKQEDVVDERMKQDFIKQINMKEPPNMTNAERGLITSSLNIVSELSIAKRISGTVNDSVEKFFHRSSVDGKAWAMSVAKIDAPATTLFADLWCIGTYACRKNHKDLSICNVWENLDGSRSIQYQRALSLPGGFKDRLFDSWVCWDGITNERTKRRTFVNASTSMDDYQGVTHHPAPEKFIKATWRGVYVVKELTDTTCEWTWAAQVDLKVPAIPTSMLDFLTKKELSWAGTVQEKYSRNRKKVDREKVDSLAKDMRRRRGEPLMEDQAPLFESCKQLLGDENSDYGWRKLASPCPHIDMKIQYFPPQKGERTVATGKAVGIVDSPAEEDEKIDAAERLDLATFMRERWQDEVYSEEENALLQRILEHLEGSFKGKSWKQLKSTDIFVKMESIYKDGTSLAIGRAVTVVDATIEDCASWEIARVTRERNKDHYDFGGLERVVEKLNSHCDLYHVAIDLRVPGLAPREWLTKCVWKMVDKNTMIVGLEDTRDEHFPVGGRKRPGSRIASRST
ncbi:hypothetical protein TrLO_g9121 [Triparma laevis f. longispina]|uniref:START domain-containing protein n=1 Tax=Triparma laevis f. longispina TaxID=1714387 RepID=A0A9W7DZ20_9STRA|nr:hypothetical protein TrLO_g9121 [Triparma laevis f. longispina]